MQGCSFCATDCVLSYSTTGQKRGACFLCKNVAELITFRKLLFKNKQASSILEMEKKSYPFLEMILLNLIDIKLMNIKYYLINIYIYFFQLLLLWEQQTPTL